MPTRSGSAAELIQQVIDELDAQISELTDQRSQLARMISAAPAVVAAAAAPAPRRRGRPKGSVKAAASGGGKKRKVSAETKRKLKAAAKARWARYRAEQGAAA